MHECPICKDDLSFLFSMGQQPLANKYPASRKEFATEVVEEMRVFYCPSCLYINIPCQINRSVFFEDYYYLSSVNKELVDHFNQLAETIKLREPRFVLDVGSNDGVLLKPLKELNIRCLGIDPSENVSQIANLAGLETLVGFFDSSSIKQIKDNYGMPDMMCASSVFTHLEDPKEFFELANELLEPRGEILIEVEYLGSIVNALGFERLYFDRPHYYSLKSLKRLGDAAGFELIKIEQIAPHGGSVRAIFARKDSGHTIEPAVGRAIEGEEVSLQRKAINRQFDLFRGACEVLKAKLEDFNANGFKVAGYGCPARFSTITNFANIGSKLLPQVVDDSPLKSGRFSPGKHVPIVSFFPDNGTDIYIVFAYEYIKSIKEKIKTKRVRYFKPIPFEAL
jgi:methylation protein EvaC